MPTKFQTAVERCLSMTERVSVKEATPTQLHRAIGNALWERITPRFSAPSTVEKRVGYFSAEFLLGRMAHANLYNLGLLTETEEWLRENGVSPSVLQEPDDPGLGNGGLGRLAACYLESGATKGLPLDGYGIRYRYGIFKQVLENGEQREVADDWQKDGDPWSVRREEERVTVRFKDQTVFAVPYDMPMIGYGGNTVNTLRLWQAESECPFDFSLFNDQKYEQAFRNSTRAQTITAVLYPNDATDAGKKLRLKQQYFFCSASLQDMIRRYKQRFGNDLAGFADAYAIQLNDTHPVIAIPELLRLLTEEEGLPFTTALAVAKRVFSYTNHTILPEALERWQVGLFRSVVPQVYRYIQRLDRMLTEECRKKGVEDLEAYRIVADDTIHMARLALFVTHKVNGVAQLHTELLKTTVLPNWYRLYPEKFCNVTNGITQRRWLAVANPELAKLITDTIGNRWITDLSELHNLRPYGDDPAFLEQLSNIKSIRKEKLAAHIATREPVRLKSGFLLDVQVKRLHEYKRQLLNAFSILDSYYGIKEGRIRDFTPTVYLFGAKAAPGYRRAKGIIRYICQIASLINGDPTVADKMQVIFVSNYDVSYAEQIIPAADVSEQISTAGTEASGTGNMKLMLNGAVTLGTYDGATVEIVKEIGEENAYLFGGRVETLQALQKAGYRPGEWLDKNDRLRRVVNTLIDGTFYDSDGVFRELYESLTVGTSWHQPDPYYLFYDFESYCDVRQRLNTEYRDTAAFFKKSLYNVAGAGKFSSDRAVLQYANEIWQV